MAESVRKQENYQSMSELIEFVERCFGDDVQHLYCPEIGDESKIRAFFRPASPEVWSSDGGRVLVGAKPDLIIQIQKDKADYIIGIVDGDYFMDTRNKQHTSIVLRRTDNNGYEMCKQKYRLHKKGRGVFEYEVVDKEYVAISNYRELYAEEILAYFGHNTIPLSGEEYMRAVSSASQFHNFGNLASNTDYRASGIGRRIIQRLNGNQNR